MVQEITLKPIGIIYTPYSQREKTPIQGCLRPE